MKTQVVLCISIVTLLQTYSLGVDVPGTIVHHSPASSGIYIGSPGIVIMPSGEYIAKCDEFGPNSTENISSKTIIFSSNNKGVSWTKLSELNDMYWATIFVHQDALYMLGNHKQYGDIVISKSTDRGNTWTNPKDSNCGRLKTDGQYHGAPVPILIHNGRIWRGMERMEKPNKWGTFQAGVMSAPIEADLLKADSWRYTNFLPFPEGHHAKHWLEGNIVVTPQGKLVNILRSGFSGIPEKAVVLEVSENGRSISINPDNNTIEMPGASGKKFTIRFDRISKHYWALVNPMLPEYENSEPGRVRNTLAAVFSPDLKTWTIHSIIVCHPDIKKHGFQYPDWVFDGEDIIAAVRTAFDDNEGGSHSYHDANLLTFHRIKNIRKGLVYSNNYFPSDIAIRVKNIYR